MIYVCFSNHIIYLFFIMFINIFLFGIIKMIFLISSSRLYGIIIAVIAINITYMGTYLIILAIPPCCLPYKLVYNFGI